MLNNPIAQGSFCPKCIKNGKHVLMNKGTCTQKCPECNHAMTLADSEFEKIKKLASEIQIANDRTRRATTKMEIGEIAVAFSGRRPGPNPDSERARMHRRVIR